jgi:hypothetical protein
MEAKQMSSDDAIDGAIEEETAALKEETNGLKAKSQAYYASLQAYRQMVCFQPSVPAGENILTHNSIKMAHIFENKVLILIVIFLRTQATDGFNEAVTQLQGQIDSLNEKVLRPRQMQPRHSNTARMPLTQPPCRRSTQSPPPPRPNRPLPRRRPARPTATPPRARRHRRRWKRRRRRCARRGRRRAARARRRRRGSRSWAGPWRSSPRPVPPRLPPSPSAPAAGPFHPAALPPPNHPFHPSPLHFPRCLPCRSSTIYPSLPRGHRH